MNRTIALSTGMQLHLLTQKIKIEFSFDVSLILCIIELVLMMLLVLFYVKHVIVGHEPVDSAVFIETT